MYFRELHRNISTVTRLRIKFETRVTYVKNDSAYFVFKSALFHDFYETIEINY